MGKKQYIGKYQHICEKCEIIFFDQFEKSRFCSRQHYIERNLSVLKDGIIIKKCIRCNIFKPMSLEFFQPANYSKNGFSSYCRECCRKKGRSEAHKESNRRSKLKNKEKILASAAIYRSLPEVKKRRNKNELSRKQSDLAFNLKTRMRLLVYASIRRVKDGRTWESLVGYSIDDLRKHIESLFTAGMDWNWFSSGHIHIDHKIPISTFNYTSPDDPDFKKCWALENLQPMWWKDNIQKGDKLCQGQGNQLI